MYLSFETNNISDVIDIINKPYFVGSSVTMPFKEEIISYLDKNNNFDAINTIIKTNNSYKMENTDSMALTYFQKDIPTYILGTGGAAIAAIKANYKNKEVYVIGRNKDKLKEISIKYKVKTIVLSDFSKVLSEHQLINCLPPIVSINKFINSNTFLIDMAYGIHNYRKDNFHILKDNYINGYDILYVQAAYQYLEWFGRKNNNIVDIIKVYKEAMDDFLNNKFE